MATPKAMVLEREHGARDARARQRGDARQHDRPGCERRRGDQQRVAGDRGDDPRDDHDGRTAQGQDQQGHQDRPVGQLGSPSAPYGQPGGEHERHAGQVGDPAPQRHGHGRGDEHRDPAVREAEREGSRAQEIPDGV